MDVHFLTLACATLHHTSALILAADCNDYTGTDSSAVSYHFGSGVLTLAGWQMPMHPRQTACVFQKVPKLPLCGDLQSFAIYGVSLQQTHATFMPAAMPKWQSVSGRCSECPPRWASLLPQMAQEHPAPVDRFAAQSWLWLHMQDKWITIQINISISHEQELFHRNAPSAMPMSYRCYRPWRLFWSRKGSRCVRAYLI